MSPDDAGSAKQEKLDKRRERLAASLRENLKRRKAQQRLRAAEGLEIPDARPKPASLSSKD
jgi:hypothetical protein